jgi:ABC-type transport system involved in cytochrome bd biosynthesis fused ATPase/permease subunit
MRFTLSLISDLLSDRWRAALTVLLACATVVSAVGLLGIAAYLIGAAALHPDLSDLIPAMYVVRLTAVSRALARYTERFNRA